MKGLCALCIVLVVPELMLAQAGFQKSDSLPNNLDVASEPFESSAACDWLQTFSIPSPTDRCGAPKGVSSKGDRRKLRHSVRTRVWLGRVPILAGKEITSGR